MSSPKYWREIPQRYRLEAGKCKKCGKIHYPPRLICSQCGAREFDTIALKDEGVLETYTIIHVAPSNFVDQAPYAIGIVKLNDNVTILMQITDCAPEELKIGMHLKLEFRKISEVGDAGVIHYGHKAIPA